jgi:hypothetical protein
MQLHARSALGFVVLSLASLLGRPAAATTYQAIADAALADQAAVVIEARIAGVDPAPLAGTIATDYLVEVERVLKGDVPGSTVVVRVAGGVDPASGVGLKIWGSPELAAGERAILFLLPASDGAYRILHMMLGAFHRRTLDGVSLALRDLSEAHEIGAASPAAEGRDAVRDYEGFARWIADRAAAPSPPQAADAPATYVRGVARDLLSTLPEKYALTLSGGSPIRWFRFDQGASTEWRVNSTGEPGLGLDASIAAFQQALAAWSSNPGTNIKYVYVGTTQATGGIFTSDGINAIDFNDPGSPDPAHSIAGTYVCGVGGVVAAGGPFFYVATQTWKGKAYHEAIEGDVVTNDGAGCLLSNPVMAAQVFAHELGHTLGLAHSLDPDALMFAKAHNDGRGARLSIDDRNAVSQLYGDGSVIPPPPPPAVLLAPAKLIVRATSNTAVSLRWTDRAVGETGYVVEMRRNQKGTVFQTVATLPAGANAAAVTGLRAATAYLFRVRATAGAVFSPYSPAVGVATPR